MVAEKSYLVIMLVSALLLMSGTDHLTSGQSPFQDIGGDRDMGGMLPDMPYYDMGFELPIIPLPYEPFPICKCYKDMPLNCTCVTKGFSRVKIEVPFLPKERSMLIVKKKYKTLGEKVVKSSDTIVKDLGLIKKDLNAIKSHLDDGDVKHDECKQ